MITQSGNWQMRTAAARPLLFTFCGPAGSGKSTICERVSAADPSLRLSISTTTRPPRSNERDGIHYNFVSVDEFRRRVATGSFIEHAEFSGNLYGTELSNIDLAGAGEKDLVLDIDVQGVQLLKSMFADRLVVVFVFPPSYSVLVKRLKSRGSEDEVSLHRRLERARAEIQILSKPGFADYLLINDTIEDSVRSAGAIIAAERVRFPRLDAKITF